MIGGVVWGIEKAFSLARVDSKDILDKETLRTRRPLQKAAGWE